MPPPKKPKSGRTSFEQFLTDEERSQSVNIRDLRDSEGHSPVGSIDTEGSDGEVFTTTNVEIIQRSKSAPSDSEPILLQKLFRKSHSVDEQKVPGSPNDSISTQNSTPTESVVDNDDCYPGFRKYRREDKVESDESRLHDDDVGPQYHSPIHDVERVNGVTERVDILSPASNSERVKLTKEQDRLLDTLVASALASSVAQTIIHARGPPATYSGTMPNFMYGQRMTFTNSVINSLDTEPHDLSKRTESNHHKLLDHRLYDNLHNMGDRKKFHQPYRDWSAHNARAVTVERSKHYLDTHKRVAGLLCERDAGSERGRDTTPMQILEKENILHSVPTQHLNGYFSHMGIQGRLPGELARFEHRQREPVDVPAMGKPEEHGPMISPGGYLPMHPMMPQTSGVGQVPSSTTVDLSDPRDMYHPALINPHLIAGDGRRIKQEHHGHSVNKLCQVCSDNASGFHYGVWSCEGCKAFFKRSIQGPVDYVCPATNTCTIDKHRRKSCQACRLRKCYEVGMNKGSQRKERKSSGSPGNKGQKRPRVESSEDLINSTSGSPVPAKNPRKSRTSSLLEALSKAELPNLVSYHNHNAPPTRVHLLNSLVKIAEKELVFLINWAKNLPGYTELSLGDQVHLIECCWMELLLLNCAFRSMEHGGRGLAFAHDLILERPYWSMMGMGEILEQVAAVSDQMVQYNLHREELLLLQATVLVNAEVRKLSSYSKLFEIRHSVLDGLVDIAQKYHPDNLRHVPSIMLLLTHIRQAAERATSYFQSLKKESSVTFCDLLSEMLDAQSAESRKTASPMMG